MLLLMDWAMSLSLALVSPALLLPLAWAMQPSQLLLLQLALAKEILQPPQPAWETLEPRSLLLARCALVCWSRLALALPLPEQLLALWLLQLLAVAA
jgi:hypothetical protein